MALQLRKHLAAQPLAALHDLGHRNLGIVVQNRLRHTVKIIEGRVMAFTADSDEVGHAFQFEVGQ